MAVPAKHAIEGCYVRSENVDADGHLPNKFRARPYLKDAYESYFCGDVCDDTCRVCKPFDNYWDGYDVGFLTGSINNVIVIDNDSGMALEEFRDWIETVYGKLPETWTAISGSGGQHFYYYYKGHFESSISSLIPKVDILGENRWCRLPPYGTHKGDYKWHIPPSDRLARAPLWLDSLNILKHHKGHKVYKAYTKGAVDEDELSQALFHIPIETVDHETWSKLGYALCTSGREALFTSWCRTDPNPKRHVTGKQLNLFRNGKPLDNPEGVVFKSAMNYGWKK